MCLHDGAAKCIEHRATAGRVVVAGAVVQDTGRGAGTGVDLAGMGLLTKGIRQGGSGMTERIFTDVPRKSAFIRCIGVEPRSIG